MPITQTLTDRRTWRDLAQRFVSLKRESETDLASASLENPSWVYTDDVHFAQEWESVFRRMPVAVGLVSDLRSPGDYLTIVVGGTPILVIRDNDGSFNGFVNVCRHRGTRLLDQRGHVESRIRCPYHSWSYDFSGNLSSTPFAAGGFEPGQLESICLPRLPVWERHGLVYTAASPEAEVDSAAVEDLDLFADDFAAIDFSSYSFFREQTTVWDLNWKLAMDAFLEHYHIFSLHKNSVAPVFVPVPSLFDGRGANSRMCVFRKHAPESAGEFESDEEFRKSGNLSYILYPNAIINLPVTGYLELWQILPESKERVRITSRMYLHSDVETAKGIGFWNKNFELSRDVNLVEDFPLQQTVFQSLKSGDLQQMIYGRNEPALIYFHQCLAKSLGTSHG
jgi:phenylpropionate dioxygenase-like ring-hydroxylating dioxygenase large terminal subunit